MLKEILESKAKEVEVIENDLRAKVEAAINKEYEKTIQFLKDNEEESKKDYNKYFQTTFKRYDEKTQQLLFYFVRPNMEKYQHETIEKVRKQFDKKVEDIVKKIDAKLKNETIKSFEKIYETSNLTVYRIFTNEGERFFKLETIFAGGMFRSVKSHTRFVVQLTKKPPRNMI